MEFQNSGQLLNHKQVHRILMSLAKVYRDINLIRPVSYWDYNVIDIPWGSLFYSPIISRKTSSYIVIKKVGRGKYSDCYRGYCTRNGQECCIKVIKPVRVKKIKRYFLYLVFIVEKSKYFRIWLEDLILFQYYYDNSNK